MKKAGFIKRFAAVFIDGLIFCALSAAVQSAFFICLSILYETILISQWGGFTIGKKVMGIKVVTESGNQVDILKAFIRSLSKLLSYIVLFLGYLWMLWDDKSQTWHDKIAETFVIEA